MGCEKCVYTYGVQCLLVCVYGYELLMLFLLLQKVHSILVEKLSAFGAPRERRTFSYDMSLAWSWIKATQRKERRDWSGFRLFIMISNLTPAVLLVSMFN